MFETSTVRTFFVFWHGKAKVDAQTKVAGLSRVPGPVSVITLHTGVLSREPPHFLFANHTNCYFCCSTFRCSWASTDHDQFLQWVAGRQRVPMRAVCEAWSWTWRLCLRDIRRRISLTLRLETHQDLTRNPGKASSWLVDYPAMFDHRE